MPETSFRTSSPKPHLLTVAEMAAADRAAIAGGVDGFTLMMNAGWGVAHAVARAYRPQPVLVLCGPGNNGGDGFAVARLLGDWGWPVQVALLGDRDRLRGDAARAAARWPGGTVALDPGAIGRERLVVDAVFGAGLTRPVEGAVAELFGRVEQREVEVVAVDVPSGLHGDSGQPWGRVLPADLTVTFFRRKPGHVLQPGRTLSGVVEVVDIGIPDAVLEAIRPCAFLNGPAVWRAALPGRRSDDHKYRRGHVVVVAGGMAGAARLASRAARRAGAGMLTVLGSAEARPALAADWPGTIVRPLEELDRYLGDERVTALVVGPGLGRDAEARQLVERCLAAAKPTVLDADALTVFAGEAEALAGLIRAPAVATPHDGEYARLFGGDDSEPACRLDRARAGADRLGAVLLLKGSDTAIAAPDGRAAINANAPATLATAGAGDVLAGIIAAHLAQGSPAFEAAAAAAWMQGEAATGVGEGLLAEDLVDALPAVLASLAGRMSG